MKTLITSVLALMIFNASLSQEKNIETLSVSIDELINFVIEKYPVVTDSTPVRNVTFLLQSYGNDFEIEDKVILKQAFKLISNRLTEQDSVSIVAYGNYNGVVLNFTNPTESKKLLYAIENPKTSIKFLEEDGIGVAYKNAKEQFTEDSENSVVMIRIPPKVKVESRKSEPLAANNVEQSESKPSRGNAVVLTAIALLPEIIKVIKD